MGISLEAFILTNLLMNVVIMAIVARSRGRVRWGRIWFAAGYGALYALAMQSEVFWQLKTPPAVFLLAAALTIVICRVDGPGALFCGMALLLGGSALLAGTIQFLERVIGVRSFALVAGALAGGAGLLAALEARGRRIEKWEARLDIRLGGRSAKMNALIDTGNRLREPISGLAVLIVEKDAIARLLPEPFEPEKRLPPGFRLAAYSALGGGGQLACFQPDETLISYGDGWTRAPDVWVAVYFGKLPGGAKALAPAVIGQVRGRAARTGENQKMNQSDGDRPPEKYRT